MRRVLFGVVPDMVLWLFVNGSLLGVTIIAASWMGGELFAVANRRRRVPCGRCFKRRNRCTCPTLIVNTP